MLSSLFSQKNICAALGFFMAITIVWKAAVETKLAKHTALIEYTEPTYNTGENTFQKADPAFEQRQLKPIITVF
ncbi:hypothetical protein [Algoriphagus aquimarinus]|uniref:hypothetical protein n=1 Tax=Algoriphagus aquimarinus TaxID=237018 RepID=UPI0030D937C3|tara:strand:- start:257 stop:478 length:222 start_codon:yes stop_codon:yes gene_type:complete